MLCQNCGKNEVTFRYTQMINGVKKELALCDECAKKLGLEESFQFNMPIHFSNFLGDFLNEAFDTNLMPSFLKTNTLQCDHCGMTYQDFAQNGKFGCSHCYDTFEGTLDSLFQNIHGSSVHTGRKSQLTQEERKSVKEDIEKMKKEDKKQPNNEKESQLENLNKQLKQAIQEERYEDAAKIRDEIKKLS